MKAFTEFYDDEEHRIDTWFKKHRNCKLIEGEFPEAYLCDRHKSILRIIGHAVDDYEESWEYDHDICKELNFETERDFECYLQNL